MPIRPCTHLDLPAWRWGATGQPVVYGDGTGLTSAQAAARAHLFGQRRAARRLAHDLHGRHDARRPGGRFQGRQPIFSDALTRAHEELLQSRLATAQSLLLRFAAPAIREAQRELSRRQDADPWGSILTILHTIREVMAATADQSAEGLRFIGQGIDDDATDSADRQLSRLFNIPLATAAGAEGLVEQWVAENVGLMTNIEESFAQALEKRVLEVLSEGTPTLDFAKELQETYGLAWNQASFIARDQTAKIAGAVAQARQTAYGIDSFQWSTSGDSRVRQKHANLDGQIFTWAEGGPGGIIPGSDFQCRCVALAVLPDDDRAALVAQAQARQEMELSILQSSPTVQGEIPNYSNFSDWNAARIEALRKGIRSAVGL